MLKVKLEPGLRLGRDKLYPVPSELISLLQAIHRLGSLLKAIEEIHVSYRHAWGLMKSWEAITGHKLAVFTRGHGAALTLFGTRLAEAGDWLRGRMANWLPALERDMVRHLDVDAQGESGPVRIHASNDIALAKLKDRLEGRLVLDLRFEGSIHSLDALARSDCDIAGFHMPEPASLLGSLAAEFRNRLNGREHHIACLFSRHQGLMVGTSASARIRRIADLTKRGVKFVNRERGSGTRLLFDAMLQRASVQASAIEGYDHEEFTHMATAATVHSGMADAAFGIEGAARVHRLRFIPMVSERYYLVCRRKSPVRVALDAIVAAARSASFQRVVSKIGGYDFDMTGQSVRLSALFPAPPTRSARRVGRRTAA